MSSTAVKRPTRAKLSTRSSWRKRFFSYRGQEVVAAYLLILPTLLGFLVFTLGPLLAGLGLSFFRYNFFGTPAYVGLENFQTLAGDQRLAQVLANTVKYVVIMVFIDLVWAMSLALALNSFIPRLLKTIFRSVFFFPVLASSAVTAIVWRYLFNFDRGIVNYFLTQIGLERVPWLVSSDWVIFSVSFMSIWNGVGFNTILLLAGLQNVPKVLYEAAEIDGAGRWQLFRHITLPMLTPIIFFILVKGLIAVFQFFSEPYVLTGGGPGDASRTIVMYIYEIGFKAHRLGYASSIALVLFVLIVIVTVLQFALSRRWVFYR